MLLPLCGGEFPLDIDTSSLIPKVVRSGGRKGLFTSIMNELRSTGAWCCCELLDMQRSGIMH